MIESLKEAVVESAAFYVGWGGLLLGIVFGFIVYRTNFCTMGSISDILSFGDRNRFRAWLLAIAVAILGVLLLEGIGVADVSLSMYQTPTLAWGANAVGGLIFGFGMVFSGGCISRNLVRAGGGDLRSIVVLLITGIFGYMTIGGLLGPLRVALFTPLETDLSASGMETQRLGEALATASGMSAGFATLLTALVVAGLLLAYCFKDPAFRASRRNLIAGIGIGLCVVVGWALTGLAYDEFADNPTLISLSYVRPVGDSIDYVMRFTALGAPGFGIVTVAGALIGGFLGAVSMGRLHLTTFADQADSIRNMFGAALMGIGGVLALGCTVGQGLTGISTLAIGSVITFLCIVLGGAIGVKTMEAIA
ncbi:YeeE/YedE family protein [Tropicimonas sp. IMCC6043]|uniref:YeeE/YedE family protein n=1 Tax=Tropicimonas sp. IMCC6043 TaxID=2510645 RepID=UPI00101D3B6D|nr:YeeE/YedE family protein [Tropicimonas sp. IMCC6043]RYH12216.1 YeeE/YedE family protein [Tropicimonas sp. IMCC6043]